MSEIQRHFLYPKLLIIILVVLGAATWQLPGLAYFFPMVEIALIYYWCTYYPESIPGWFILTIGILCDILTGVPLGIYTFTLVVLRFAVIASRQRYQKEEFSGLWLGFCVFAGLAITMRWLLFSFIHETFIPIHYALIQLCLTIIFYPILHRISIMLHHSLENKVTHA